MMNTVISWKVDTSSYVIDLAEMVKDEKKFISGEGMVRQYYPVNRAKKLFRLILMHVEDEQRLSEIEEYLKKRSSKFYDTWIKEKLRWEKLK